MDELLSLKEAGLAMRRSARCLYDWSRQGFGPTAFTIRRRIYYKASDVRAFVDGAYMQAAREYPDVAAAADVRVAPARAGEVTPRPRSAPAARPGRPGAARPGADRAAAPAVVHDAGEPGWASAPPGHKIGWLKVASGPEPEVIMPASPKSSMPPPSSASALRRQNAADNALLNGYRVTEL